MHALTEHGVIHHHPTLRKEKPSIAPIALLISHARV